MDRTDRSIKEKLLLLLSSVIAAAVIPFAIFRAINEQWAIAVLDFSLVGASLGVFLHVYVNRETRGSGIVIALTGIAVALASLHLHGVSQVLWLYPALTAVFFLLDVRLAILVSALALGAATIVVLGTASTVAVFTMLLSASMSIVFAYAFSLTAKRQQMQLEQLAAVDPLTGAGNRRGMNDILDSVSALFHRSGIPCSILIFDIDHFKAINDTHGHVIGDNILVEVADLIGAHIRVSDSLHRYGGEEFIIVTENTLADGAAQEAEKLRALIDAHVFRSDIHLTVSFGVAELHRGEGRQGWLGRADQALFYAKNSGRNRVELAPPASDTAFTPPVAGETKVKIDAKL